MLFAPLCCNARAHAKVSAPFELHKVGRMQESLQMWRTGAQCRTCEGEQMGVMRRRHCESSRRVTRRCPIPHRVDNRCTARLPRPRTHAGAQHTYTYTHARHACTNAINNTRPCTHRKSQTPSTSYTQVRDTETILHLPISFIFLARFALLCFSCCLRRMDSLFLDRMCCACRANTKGVFRRFSALVVDAPSGL